MDALHEAPRSRGFTLVEMLVALAILAILLVPAVHFGRRTLDSMRLSAFTNAFLSQMHLARSEAIKRRGPVALCKSPDGASCAAEGGWEQGWIVFHDSDGSGTREAGERIVHRVEALPAGFRVRGNAAVGRYVSFASTGATRTTSGAFQAGTLTLCRTSGAATEARQIVINAVGRPRVRKVQVGRCDAE